jgi:hypothetical protein
LLAKWGVAQVERLKVEYLKKKMKIERLKVKVENSFITCNLQPDNL